MLVLMTDNFSKSPRLYVTPDLRTGARVDLPEDQSHYLKNVMRLSAGDDVRIFNGRDGEWHATLQPLDKKKIVLALMSQIRPQPPERRPVHLLFAPIKKAHMEWLIEKAVELGATDLYPVITQHTDVRQINAERTMAQIIEAAEQCERLDVPRLHELIPLPKILPEWANELIIQMAVERADAPDLQNSIPDTGPVAFLIGPEGGFSAEERDYPRHFPFLRPVSLGPDILRSETAACYMLAAAKSVR